MMSVRGMMQDVRRVITDGEGARSKELFLLPGCDRGISPAFVQYDCRITDTWRRQLILHIIYVI